MEEDIFWFNNKNFNYIKKAFLDESINNYGLVAASKEKGKYRFDELDESRFDYFMLGVDSDYSHVIIISPDGNIFKMDIVI